LKYLLNDGRKIRDCIVHPSPKIDPASMRMEKAGRIMGIEISQAMTAVDSAVRYVRQLNAALGAHGCDLWWSVERDSAGVFPDAAFQ
jgi:hypothetical protein